MKISTVRRYALSLPRSTEEPHFHFASFRVAGKIFVTVPPDDEHIHVFVGEEERAAALALHSTFVEPLTWGAKVVGLRITLADADAVVVKRLIDASYAARAAKPKRSAAALKSNA